MLALNYFILALRYIQGQQQINSKGSVGVELNMRVTNVASTGINVYGIFCVTLLWFYLANFTFLFFLLNALQISILVTQTFVQVYEKLTLHLDAQRTYFV